MAALGSVLAGSRVTSNAPAFLRGIAVKQSAVPASGRPGSRSGPVTTKAFFGGLGGGPKQKDGQPMICIDCGYVFRGDFNSLPNDWECPPCGSRKNRFKPQQAAGMAYADMAAQKKANKAAMAAKKKGGPRCVSTLYRRDERPNPRLSAQHATSRVKEQRDGEHASLAFADGVVRSRTIRHAFT